MRAPRPARAKATSTARRARPLAGPALDPDSGACWRGTAPPSSPVAVLALPGRRGQGRGHLAWRTWRAGATWISTATTRTTSAMAIPALIAAVKRQLDDAAVQPTPFRQPVTATALARKLPSLDRPRAWTRCCSPPADRMRSTWRSSTRARSPAAQDRLFWDSFHGAGFGAASVGGEAIFRSGKIGPLLPGATHVAPFACYRCPYGYPARDGAPDLALCRMACANMVSTCWRRKATWRR